MNRYNGFTLIELLLVTIVLGILVSFAVGGIQDYQKLQTAEGIEATVAATGSDCDIVIDRALPMTEVNTFLKRHEGEFTATFVGEGTVIHRKRCDR